MQKELLGLSQCLSSHPVLMEKMAYKIKYLNVLEYFVNRFSKEDLFSREILNLYIQKFVGKENYFYDVTNIRKVAKKVNKLKFKGYRLFRYRYILLFDCFFINAFHEPNRAIKIKEEVKSIFHERYHIKIEQLYQLLYNNDKVASFKDLNNQLHCWEKNKEFFGKPIRKILITANMSAGKSTLINALIGKRVNRTQNDACTAKIHYIFNKPLEDGYSYEWDGNLDLDAELTTLMQDNPNNRGKEISVGTFFRLNSESNERICIIDTPGVNSYANEEHRAITEQIIKDADYDELVYIMNAENSGTIDDKKHLLFVLENVKDKPIIFVINKLDTFSKDEDTISEIVEGAEKELIEMGFKKPVICPVSAYAAVLAKKMIWNNFADEDEKISYAINRKRFLDEAYDLSNYYNEDKREFDSKDKKEQAIELLYRSGYINLEKLLCK